MGQPCQNGRIMQTSLRSTAVIAVSILLTALLTAATAHAQGYVAPSLGVTFANPSAQGRADFVADLGWLSTRDPLGVELDVMYAPSFFGNEGPYGQNSVTTVMANIVLAGGSGGRYGFGRRRSSSVRPFLSGGIGVMHEVVTTSDAASRISNNDLGLNLGVGIMAFASRSVGVRGDLRYFRDLIDNQTGNTTNIDFGAFHFWRGSIGVILAF
jgi:Outer membrane protein beta-barrel domain